MLRIALGLTALVALLARSAPAAADQDVYPPPPAYQGGYPPPPNQGGYPPPANQGGYPAGVAPQAARPDPTAERHDGTYLRLYLGPGYLHSSATVQGSNFALKGGAVGFGVAVGGTVAPNLVIYGELAFLNVSDPTLTLDGSSGTVNGTSFDHLGVGPGVTYYFMPINLFLSASLLLGRVQVNDKNNDSFGQTDFGASIHLSVGKEWWVSPQWGLGASVQGLLARNHDSGVAPGGDGTFTSTGFVVAFSATYN